MHFAQMQVQVVWRGEATEADVTLEVSGVQLGAGSQLHGHIVNVEHVFGEIDSFRVALVVAVFARELAFVLRLQLLRVLANARIWMLLIVMLVQFHACLHFNATLPTGHCFRALKHQSKPKVSAH